MFDTFRLCIQINIKTKSHQNTKCSADHSSYEIKLLSGLIFVRELEILSEEGDEGKQTMQNEKGNIVKCQKNLNKEM